MSTVQDVIDLAAMRSQLNDSALINSTLLTKAVSRYERLAYIRAARVDPAYFGTTGDTASRAAFTDPWSITQQPGGMAAVTSAYVSAITGTVAGISVGDKISIIDLRFPDVEISPRAYIRGQKLYGYNNELGSATANMVTKVKLNYAMLPPDLTALTTALAIPEEWIDLVVLPIAKLMCLRDRRPDDASLIDAELKDLYDIFEQAVLMFAHGGARPLPSIFPLPMAPARAGS